MVKREIIMPVSSAGVVSRSMKKPSQQKERHFMSLAKESITVESIHFPASCSIVQCGDRRKSSQSLSFVETLNSYQRNKKRGIVCLFVYVF